MYNNVSDDLKNAVKGNVITSSVRLTFKNFFPDSDLILEGEDVSSNGMGLADFCYDDREGHLIGTAMSKELEIEIENKSDYDFSDKSFDLEIGILIDRQNSTYEYVPYGEFLVVSYEDLKSSKKYRLIANDLMIKTNEPYNKNTNFNPTFPITLKNFYREFMSSYGIEIEEQTLPNENFMINAMPNFDGYTGRQVLMRMAELFGSFAKINRNNKCEMYLKTETEEIIRTTQMNSKLEINKKYGPVNVVTIGLGNVEGENVTLQDLESIETNGETTIRIDDNPFTYTEELREQVIHDLYNRLLGFTYVPVSFKYKALMYLDCGDAIKVEDINTGELVETIVFNQNIKVPRTRQSNIATGALTNTAQQYKYISKTKQEKTRTEILVEKHEKKISSIVEEIGDRTDKSSTITQELDEINSKVSNIADITNVIEGIKSIEIPDAMNGQVIELHIYGNNTVFGRLYPSNTLYPSNNLLPIGSSIIRVTYEDETFVDYDLEITKALKQQGKYCDEFVLKDEKAYVLRRIQDDGVILEDGIVENERELIIDLKEGINKIEILNYTANMEVKYATLNDYTDLFATKVEMRTSIEQTTQEITANVTKIVGDVQTQVTNLTLKTGEIDARVSEKVGKNEVIADLNIAVKEGQGIIELIGNILKIQMDNFQLTEKGDMTANSGTIAGWTINSTYLGKGLAGIQGIGNTSSDADVFYAGKGLGYNGNPAFHVTNQGNLYVKSLNIKGRNSSDIGQITIYNVSNQVGTTITDSKTESYYMIAGNGGTTPTLGKCMHGYNMYNDFRCLWQDTKLYFIVDDSNIGYVTTSSSDARLKEHITDIPQELLYVIEEIELKQFKLVNGTGKFKFGIIAQDLVNAFKKYELDYKEYEIISEIQLDLTDETLYFTIDYEQLLILKNQLLDDRVKALEKKVENILEKLEKLGEV